MRTKHILTAMLLPALFAACTSDEVLEGNTDNLQGRALLDPNFGVSVKQDGPNSRFAWDGKWEMAPTDQFSAGLADGIARYTVGSDLLTNYVFSGANETGNFTTTSKMVEGVYFFYSYPKSTENTERGKVKFNLGTQSADLSNPKATVDASQLFITPLYNIEAKTSSKPVGLTFYSYWSTAAIVLKNETKETLKMSQIILEGTANCFDVAGTLDLTKLGTCAAGEPSNLCYTYDETADSYVLPEGIVEKDVIKSVNISAAGVTQSNTLALNCNSYELAAGAEVTAYMAVPATAALSNFKVKVIVNAADGKSKMATIAGQAGTGVTGTASSLASVQFNRHNVKALFGYTTANQPKPFGLTIEGNTGTLRDQDAYYIDNVTALKSLMDANQNEGAKLPIYNFGDLVVNDDIVAALTSNNVNLEFKNAITVTAGKGTLKNVTFSGKVIFAGEGSLALGDKVVVADGMDVTKGIVVAQAGSQYKGAATVKGGKLQLDAEMGKIPSSTASQFEASPSIVIDTKGEVVINAAIATKASVNTEGNGLADISFTGTIVKAGDVALTVNASTPAKAVSLTVGAALTIPAKVQVTNNGTITLGNITVTNAGTINNIGTFDGAAATAFANTGKITNTGVLKTVNNTGSIVMASGAAELYTLTGTGTVDNTLDGYITDATGSNNVVFATITASKTGTFAIPMECNKVILDGGMTWTNAAVLSGVTAIEVKNATIAGADVAAAFPVGVTSVVLDGATIAANVTFAQDVTVMGATNFNATVTMPDNATAAVMTIGADATTGDAAAKKIAKAINERTSLKISTGGKITSATATNGYTIVNNAKVYNRGTVEKLAELVASVEGAEWFYNVGTKK